MLTNYEFKMVFFPYNNQDRMLNKVVTLF